MKKILITAFEPFGGKDWNASAEVIRLLPETIGRICVQKMILPVQFGKATELVLQQSADMIFLLGEAGNRNTVTPEIQAVNLRNARIPDQAGSQPRNEKISREGPDIYRTRVPAERIVTGMREEGYPIRVSEDAGTYVCNDTFYGVGMKRRIPVEFIHCPAEPERAEEYANIIQRFIQLAVSEEQTVQEAQDYIRNLFSGNTDGHGFDHSMRVYRNAMKIAETEPAADLFIVSVGALLHDADDTKIFQTENNAHARAFLKAHGIRAATEEEICRIINGVSFSKNRDRSPETIEGKIIQDADRLDAVGAIGIARTFAYGGKHGRSPEESIAHFYEKLLLLKDRMTTVKGKEMAESRHAFLELFLKEWDQEKQP